MIIAGIILAVCGGIAALWAGNMRDSFEYAWSSFLGDSEHVFVDVVLYAGIFALVVGFVLLIVGAVNRNSGCISYGSARWDPYGNANPMAASVKTGICKQCGARVDTSMPFCPHCGRDNRVQRLPNTHCPGCGATLEQDAKFCSQCGWKLL